MVRKQGENSPSISFLFWETNSRRRRCPGSFGHVNTEQESDIPVDVFNSLLQGLFFWRAEVMPSTYKAGERDGGLGNEADIVGVVLDNGFQLDAEQVNFVIEAADEGGLLKTAPSGVINDAGIKPVFAGVLVTALAAPLALYGAGAFARG